MISKNGSGSFLSQTKEDHLTEGVEKAELTFYSDPERALPVASELFEINDTSVTPDVGFNQVLFDFDYNDSFYDLGINIDASFSTASTDSTWIHGGNTSRVKSYDFDSFMFFVNFVARTKQKYASIVVWRFATTDKKGTGSEASSTMPHVAVV